MDTSAAAAIAGDMIATYVQDIEDLVAQDSLLEALKRLQDFTKDFLPSLRQKVLILCGRHSQWRTETTAGLTPHENINDIRGAILDLTSHVGEQAQNNPAPAFAAPVARPAPAAKVHLIVDNDRDIPDAAPSQAPAEAQEATLDSLRRQYFEIKWQQEDFIACDCQQVSKRYARGDFTLQPTSIKLRGGEITAVVGLNASGKTTFLRLLMGDLKPDAGRVTYPRLAAGKSGWRHIRDQIAFIPQLPEKWHGRLRNNLNFVAAGHARPGQDLRQLVEWNIVRYGMQRYDDATWDELSGGYKIRFELIRALISQPQILVLDEPLAYLDVIACQRFLADLKTIATSLEQPIPVIITSQHLHEIEAVADQLVLLDNGVCKYSGSLAGVAALVPDCMFEITLAAARENLVSALNGLGLKEAERTMGGFILKFPKNIDASAIFQRLHVAFGGRFKAFRDISGSARGLIGNIPE